MGVWFQCKVKSCKWGLLNGYVCFRLEMPGEAFEVFVGVEVLASGLEVAVGHEALDGDDVAIPLATFI